MDAAVRELVRKRADHRCEYCRLPQRAVDVTFHVEHIVARQHGGDGDSSEIIRKWCRPMGYHTGFRCVVSHDAPPSRSGSA